MIATTEIEMRLSLEKHGGLAAGIRHPPCIVECPALPEQKMAELSKLVAAVKDADLAFSEKPGQMRDGMTFTISIEEGGETTAFQQSDMDMSEAFANLLIWMERYVAETSQ